MIDSARVRRLLTLAAALFSLAVPAGLLHSTALAGGLLLGFALGAAPFASWAWILSRAMRSRRARLLAAVLVILKLALYAGAMALFVRHAHPVGILAGLGGVLAIVLAGSLVRPAGEAA
jgi:hypothetical protein